MTAPLESADSWWSASVPPDAAADEHQWLGATAQLDLDHPKVRITAQKLTQARQTHAARAAALHDFVRRLPFSTRPIDERVTASEVLRIGCGDCHSKGVLFVALCRAAGLPARLLYVQLRPRYLNGILSEVPTVMPHAVGQVFVEGRWHSTDGYVIDPALFANAKALLRESVRDCGWGIVREARGVWDGRSESLHQFRAADVLDVFGSVHDPAHFCRSGGSAPPRGWLGGWRLAVRSRLVNRRVARVRTRSVQQTAGTVVVH